MDYLKLFQNHSEYEDFVSGGTMVKPNVSHCVNENEVHYNPKKDNRQKVVMMCYTGYSMYLGGQYDSDDGDPIKKVEIDDGTVLDSENGYDNMYYTFETEGLHTLYYTLYDEEQGYYLGKNYDIVEVYFPDSVKYAPGFAYCGNLKKIVYGSGVVSIGVSNPMPNLETLIVSEKNTKYDSRNNCNAVIETQTNKLIIGCKNTVIPNTVVEIGRGAFYGRATSQIIIPNSVTSIGEGAFENCSGLTSITIPDSVTSIGDTAFRGCTSLPVDNNIRYADTFLVETTNKNQTTYTIKNSTMFIGSSAFYNCKSLTSITIPDSVISIGSNAFSGCTSLSSITIPDGVTSIGRSAFSSCSGLTSITIPDSVTSIGDWAFSSCSGLTSVTCDAIIPPTLESEGQTFYKTNNCPIYVPSASVDTYKAARNWSSYADRIQAKP